MEKITIVFKKLMPKESKENKIKRAANIVRLLDKRYPNQATLLKWDNDPFKLVIAVSLSAQTTDDSVNKVTPKLWKKYKNAKALSKAKQSDIEKIIHSIGFYKNKARNAIACSKMICEKFNGVVPSKMEDLVKLPGVGRKTANVVQALAFGECEGIAVDTHVFRIMHRLKFSNAKTPAKTEDDILKIFPKKSWINLNNQLVRFGREICSAKNPKCNKCPIKKYCTFNNK